MVKIAVLGLGTVGTGVVKVVAENQEMIQKKLGQPMSVKYALVRHFRDKFRELMVDDFSLIESDPEVSVVVETIGGVEAAYEYTKRALAAGKHVVTANKQLVAEHGVELMELALKYGVSYRFEASVGGGIPALQSIRTCFSGNTIEEVYGILNGTTNYILTKMVREGAAFSDALKEAQEKGYAELDPTADVKGHDAARKTAILCGLAFGRGADLEKMAVTGIDEIQLDDVEIAQKNGYQIKLLGRTKCLDDGKYTAYVSPHLICRDNLVSQVNDVFNAVCVKGYSTGEVVLYGRGAGEMPTASACVSDVVNCFKDPTFCKEWEMADADFVVATELPLNKYYVRAENSLQGDLWESLSGSNHCYISKDLLSEMQVKKILENEHVIACWPVLA